ncbi:MAG: ROK family protein [Crocinitomicaceae bacterium]
MITQVALGIDIGGTNTVFGLIDENGNCLEDGKISTKHFNTAELLVAAIANEITYLLTKNSNFQLSGIGIGAPNGNFLTGSVEYAPNLHWKGIVNLVDLFKLHFNVPAFVTNDANAAAIGEMTYGAAQQMDDFLLVTLGTGLGSGFVSNGELIYGHDGFAGELGHVIIDPNGRLCGCKRKGCLETYASATGIVNTALEMLKNNSSDSTLNQLGENINSEAIANAASTGDGLALKVFDYTAEKLAFGLANAVPITSPKAIILFGGLANSGELLLKPLNRYFEKFLLKIYKGKVNIIVSELKDNQAAILGASSLVWNEIQKPYA